MATKATYNALPQTEADEIPLKQEPLRTKQSYLYLVHLTLIITYSLLFFIYAQRTTVALCTEKLSLWSPALKEIEWQERAIDGDFYTVNKFRTLGTPTEETQLAWESIMKDAAFSLHEDDFAKLGKSMDEKQWVKLPDENGGGYVGIFEVVHLLHCLDHLRKERYPDMYGYIWKDADPEIFRHHQDHCVDILRQHLMCTADMTVLPFHISPDFPDAIYPIPDFSARHKCRNYDKLLSWTTTNERALQWDVIEEVMKDIMDQDRNETSKHVADN